MGIIAVTIIFLCICVDNMVSANMSAMKMTSERKSVFSIKMALFFAGFNALFFGLGYLVSIIFFRDWVYFAHNWVAFAFILLLGIKFMLESIEKSPSFSNLDADDNRKMIKVSSVIGLNSFLVGYAVETMDKSFFPQVLILLFVTFAMTLLGFHLGSKTTKTIASKKVELIAGLILIVMAVRLIIV
ncbi:manganese efflux pump MntP family protein [Candidatus Avelusimicrobium alvi]|uniref:manganese efflux pump MntP n=1 Tax=Candidatus Avelusimicrobium alvi TaxID=3416221 RepID=UPI003D0A6F2F